MITKEGDKYVAVVDLGDGSAPQKFYGETHEEVVLQLVKAQQNATRTIRDQKKLLKLTAKPEQAPRVPEFRPQELSADERFVLASQLNDPSKVDDVINRVIESKLGASLESVREVLHSTTAAQEMARVQREAQSFLAAHPSFVPNPHNEDLMLKYLEARGYDYTAHNLALAFEDLKDLLQLKTEAIPSEPTFITASNVVVRPRQASTGIPANGSAPRATPRVGLTVEEIERMPTEEYRRKMADPKFRDLVEKAYRSPRT